MNDIPALYPRLLQSRLAEAMADTPVVLVAGPRQAGKTTLVRQMATQGMRYLTLDDDLTRLSAKEDPSGLVRNLDRAIIDEVQRAPDLLLAIKKTVDEDRRPGRFLLTGSANLLALPSVADSLAGRMETLTLFPLSQSEIRGGTGNWLDQAFAGEFLSVRDPIVGDALVEEVIRGGYPEAVSRTTARRRTAWAKQYIDAILQRDVRDIADVGKLDQLPRFLRALAQVRTTLQLQSDWCPGGARQQDGLSLYRHSRAVVLASPSRSVGTKSTEPRYQDAETPIRRFGIAVRAMRCLDCIRTTRSLSIRKCTGDVCLQ